MLLPRSPGHPWAILDSGAGTRRSLRVWFCFWWSIPMMSGIASYWAMAQTSTPFRRSWDWGDVTDPGWVELPSKDPGSHIERTWGDGEQAQLLCLGHFWGWCCVLLFLRYVNVHVFFLYIFLIHNIIYVYWVSLCLCRQRFIETVLNRHRPLRINILTTEARDLANHCVYLKNSKLFHEATWVKIVAGLLSTKKTGNILVISVGSSQSWSSSMPVKREPFSRAALSPKLPRFVGFIHHGGVCLKTRAPQNLMVCHNFLIKSVFLVSFTVLV